MDFGKALEALKDNKKLTRKSSRALGNGKRWIEFVNVVVDGKSEAKSFFIITDGMSHCKFLPCDGDLLADDWEIVSDAPEVTAEDVISEYETWLMKAIHESYATTNFFNPYYVKCFLELNRLSTSKHKTPEKGDVELIDGNHAVVKTGSGKYTIVHLF